MPPACASTSVGRALLLARAGPRRFLCAAGSNREPRPRPPPRGLPFLSRRPPRRLDAAEAMAQPWDVVYDTRSPADHGAHRVPGAVLATMLSAGDAADIAAAKRRGGGFAARVKTTETMHRGVARVLAQGGGAGAAEPAATAGSRGGPGHLGRGARVLVYCGKGGAASHLLAETLAGIGLDAAVLYDGYECAVPQRPAAAPSCVQHCPNCLALRCRRAAQGLLLHSSAELACSLAVSCLRWGSPSAPLSLSRARACVRALSLSFCPCPP